MHQVVRTADLPRAERFTFWLDMLAQMAMPVELRSSRSADFLAMARHASVGPIGTIVLKQPPIDVDRTRRLIRRSDPEVYHLALNLAGHQYFTQDRRELLLRPGEMMLYHSSLPFRTRADPGNRGESAMVLVIPPALLPLPAHQLRRVIAARLPRHEGLSPLVSRYLFTLVNGAATYRPADAARLSRVTIDLISIMLSRLVDLDPALPAESSDRVLFASIQAFILRRLTDPTLSPETIAAAHHLSLRTLHRIFHGQAMTVSGSIRARRLDLCRRELTDPHSRHQPIRAIAQRWGFADYVTFSRAFKAAYGTSPRDHRQSDSPTMGAGPLG